MTNTVIVPLDGSDASEQALPFAQLIAERHEGRLKLMSVVEVSTEFDAWIDTAAFSLEDELDSWLVERREYLSGLASSLGENVQTEVRVGRPAEEIRAVVESTENAVLVLASHGRGGLQQIVLGSVALKVIHEIHSPVVVVHMQSDESALPTSLDCVLFPTDGTEFSESIIGGALGIVGEPKPRIHLLHVMESPKWGANVLNAGLVNQYIEASREMSENHLEELTGQLREYGYDVRSELRDGSAADQILECAKSSGADLIAMATHGRGGIGRLILGSVANRVLQGTTVPLLLIHPSAE